MSTTSSLKAGAFLAQNHQRGVDGWQLRRCGSQHGVDGWQHGVDNCDAAARNMASMAGWPNASLKSFPSAAITKPLFIIRATAAHTSGVLASACLCSWTRLPPRDLVPRGLFSGFGFAPIAGAVWSRQLLALLYSCQLLELLVAPIGGAVGSRQLLELLSLPRHFHPTSCQS